MKVEVKTPATYKQFVTKHVKMLNHYVKFTPHPRSLDGLTAPSEAQLKEFGFTDTNKALAGTVEALRNAPNSKTNQITKAEIATMVQKAVKEGNKSLKCEILTDMQEIKDNIIEEANNNTRTITNELKGKLDQKLKLLMDAVTDTRDLLQPPQLTLPNNSQLN